jgi:hypothetical protein
MATKKTANINVDNFKYKELFESCPYYIVSEFELENFNSQTGSAYSRFIIETINKVRKIDSDLETETNTFEKKCLEEQKTKLLEILDQQDLSTLTSTVTNWQESEQDYWVNFLGKQAAIELLTFGRPTVETMSKMVKLPEHLYVKATQICVRLANAIKTATSEAEVEIGVVNNQENISDDNKPKELKKVLLKKIK